MRPLNREITSQYDVNIKKYQYIRSSYYLDTNKGKFILRKVDLPKEQILFSYEVDTHLKNEGFFNISAIYTTKKKSPYAMIGDQYYMLQHYVNCDETDFKDFEDLRQTILVLAAFHKAATGIESNVKDIEQIKIKNIYEYYCKRYAENIKLKKNIVALSQKSNFEMLFLEGAHEYKELEEIALSSIDFELVKGIIEKVKSDKIVAHRDYTYHTVNKTPDHAYIMSQIDNCNYDIQIMDLSQILCKIMQKNEWNSHMLYELIEAYNAIRPLEESEFKLLKFLMIYPEKFNSICYKYINSKRRWNYSMFEQKWINMLVYKENQLRAAKEIIRW